MTFLDKIIEEKKKELSVFKGKVKELGVGKNISPVRNFLSPFKKKGTCIIAEIKQASPSRGRICDNFNPVDIARIYEENGACALSVLTEKKFFMGDLSFIADIKKETALPVLRKDFIIDKTQIRQSRLAGADAILLIARILSKEELKDFVSLTFEEGMTPLVEVHDERDIEKALFSNAGLIGINNRDLETFKTDIGISLRLRQLIPDDRVVISESGIRQRRDIETLSEAGFKGFLIGESLMMEEGDGIGKKLRGLLALDTC